MADQTPNIPSESELPFTNNRQLALLGFIITNSAFFDRIRPVLKPTWFQDANAKKLLKTIDDYVKEYGCLPKSSQDLVSSNTFMRNPSDDRVRIAACYKLCMEHQKAFSTASLDRDMQAWMQYVYLKEMMARAGKEFQKRDLAKSAQIIATEIKGFFNIQFDAGYEETLATPSEIFRAGIEARKVACTLGDPLLDHMIDETCTGGSLLPAQTTALLAPFNIGKTSVAINIAIHNIKKGKRVLFVPLEGSSQELKEKIWAAYLGESKGVLQSKVDQKEIPENLLELWNGHAQHLKNYFTYMPVIESGLTLQKLLPMIHTKQQEMISKSEHGYDMIIVDYPGVLMNEGFKGGGDASIRAQINNNYRAFCQLAGELNTHCLVALQTNREAAKETKGLQKRTHGKRLVLPEDAAESIDPVRNVDNLITINRDSDAQKFGYMTLYIGKCRSGEVNKAYLTKTDFARTRTHGGEDLPSCWYYGSMALEPEQAVRALSNTQTFDKGRISEEIMLSRNI